MMKRLSLITATVVTLMLAPAGSAIADYGFSSFDVTYTNPDGTPVTQAGSHPFAMTTSFGLNYGESEGRILPDGDIKDLNIGEIVGFTGDTTATPRCQSADFLNAPSAQPSCSLDTQVGQVALSAGFSPGGSGVNPVFNLVPPPGKLVRLGFNELNVPVIIDIGLSTEPEYNVVVPQRNVPQILKVFSVQLRLWGNPEDPAYDHFRRGCGQYPASVGQPATEVDFDALAGASSCPVGAPNRPFLTVPRACNGPLVSSYETVSWQEPENWVSGIVFTHDGAEPANAQGFTGCSRLHFSPSIRAQPTTRAARSPTGLDFSLDVHDEGLANPKDNAHSDIKKVVVTLPEGMTVNPSLAEGLNVCSEADLNRETLSSEPGAGCPNGSKIGSVEVESPLVDENVNGSLFIATPYDNPFNSLIALYVVIKNPRLGIMIKQPLKVEPDPVTGRLTTVSEDMPQLVFSHFRLHFREGARSPLASPPTCGTYDAEATLYPWSGGAPVHSTSAFQIISGPDAGPCPNAGLPPFHPELLAGTLNNAAGAFSPFNLKITRTDSEQEITHFSIKLPPGVAGKLAGIPFCSDAQIARAAARTGPHGGAEELVNPSCPIQSQVGRTLAGSGVGPSLAYAPGKIYLAGPYHGAPISFVSITSGVVGPFDIGTVVVRLAIKVNPETGEVFLDSVGSDPIPHIIHGIPIHLRDIRAYTDKPEFTFNPTSCERKATAATVLGSGLDFVSEADDNPFVSTSPFQAADCAALPFEPRLSLRLIGGTKRGAHPALKAFLRMRGFGEAGVARARVTLPRSEFIENAHFNTICTRVQFKQLGGNGEACPKGSIYGWARAKTPILADPVEGPIFLRSSEHQLPDVVASLRGSEINVHLVGHVDSIKGQLRNTFETVPDAPVEWASFKFKGAKKGLFVNSTNLCKRVHRAKVEFAGQNGKRARYGAPLKVKCKKRKAKRRSKGHERAAR